MGYSQETFAALLAVDRSTVVRWERGEVAPQPYIRPKLARLLDVSAHELAALLEPEETPIVTASPVSAVPVPLPPYDLDAVDDDMNRRELLRLLSTAGALIAVPELASALGTEQTSPEAVIDYERMNPHLWQAFSLSQSKRAVYPIVRQQLGLLTTTLQQPHSETTHRRLCMLAADLFQLAGEIFFDGNRYTDAAYCYTLAADASKEAGAYDLWACALTRHAFIGMYERRFDVVPMLGAALAVARRGDTQLSTRYWVATVQAQAFAGLGDLDGCTRALDQAEAVQGLGGALHNGGWLRFDGSRLAEERGSCYVALGRPDLAEAALTAALQQRLSMRRRGSVLTDLASLGVQRGDADEVLMHGTAALELATHTSSGWVSTKLRGLRDQLAPLHGDRRVQSLSDEIAALDIRI
jgi:transcriptional regulator with XRE-family HTH domain